MPLNFSPDAIKDNEAEQARSALQELKAQIIAEQTVKTREKINENTLVLTAEDFAKGKFSEKLAGDPPDIEKLMVVFDSLSNEPAKLKKALLEMGISREILKKMYDELDKKYDNLFMNKRDQVDRARDYNAGHSEKYQKNLDDIRAPYERKLEKISKQKIAVAKMIDVFNLPQDSEKIDPKIMDPVFEEILQNPKFAGTVKDNPELNQLVFNAFPPQFQKRFKELNLKVLVKKWDDGEIDVYFVCGTDKNGKEYKVKMAKNYGGAKNIEFCVLNDPKYGEVLSQTDARGYIQQIREISPTELELVVIRASGEVSATRTITKNPISTEKVANN